MVYGPVPANVTESEFLEVRAQHLSAVYELDLDDCRRDLRAQLETLEAFRNHDEVVLWFEHDLFCQIHLIYLLNWFSQQKMGKTKLSLICIGEFPGVPVFHGLGQLNEDQLKSLFPRRKKVTPAQLKLAATAWEAYTSPDPLSLIALRDSNTLPLPFLKRAIVNHLWRFPWTRSGLGKVENTALTLVAQGHGDFKKLFPAFVRKEPDYGFGDAQLYVALKRMVDAPVPLLKQNGRNSSTDPAGMLLSSFQITTDGEEVLAGEQDFVVQNGIDMWLGGVHLLGPEAAWRWDEKAENLMVSL